jgi:hypothetical protein
MSAKVVDSNDTKTAAKAAKEKRSNKIKEDRDRCDHISILILGGVGHVPHAVACTSPACPPTCAHTHCVRACVQLPGGHEASTYDTEGAVGRRGPEILATSTSQQRYYALPLVVLRTLHISPPPRRTPRH